jgi:hypothetical protein
VACLVVSGKEPVLASDGHAFQRPFRGVVVDIEEALRGVVAQRLPLVSRVRDRLAERTARQDLGACPGRLPLSGRLAGALFEWRCARRTTSAVFSWR